MIVVCCTSCKTKFKAQESVKGSLVECPVCQEQFIAEDLNALPEISAIKPSVAETKPLPAQPIREQAPLPAQPAEHKSAPADPISPAKNKKGAAQEFGKTFKDVSPNTASPPVDYSYTEFEKSLIPQAAWKQAVDILSWVGVIIGALILILGSLKGGFLTDAGHDKRFLIAGFISLLGTAGFIASSVKRSKAIIISALSVIVLFALAFYLPIFTTPTKNGESNITTYSIGPLKNEVRR